MTTYDVHGVLTVKTNGDLPIPSFLEGDGDASRELHVERRDRIPVPGRSWGRRLASHRYWVDDGTLTVSYPSSPTGQQVRMRLSGLPDQRTRLEYTPKFRSMVDFSGLFEGLLTRKLLDAGVALIHAGAVVVDGEATVLASMGRMGKTSTILSLLATENDLGFMSDNLLLVDADGRAYAWPATLGVYPGTAVDPDAFDRKTSRRMRVRRLVARSDLLAAGLLHVLGQDLSVDVPPEAVADEITSAASIRRIYLLNGGTRTSEARVLARDATVQKLATGTDMELDPDDYYLSLYAFTGEHAHLHPTAVKSARTNILESAVDELQVVELRADGPGEYVGGIDL